MWEGQPRPPPHAESTLDRLLKEAGARAGEYEEFTPQNNSTTDLCLCFIWDMLGLKANQETPENNNNLIRLDLLANRVSF